MSASSSLSAAGLRERLDELLAAASSASRDGARLQEDLGLLRSVLGGNIEPSVTPDIARVAVSVLEKLAIDGTIEFDVGLEELLQYIRSQADRGARIVAAQAVFKVIRARLGSSDSAIDAEAKVCYQADISKLVSVVSSDSLLCRPLNQAIDSLKKAVDTPITTQVKPPPTPQPVDEKEAVAPNTSTESVGEASNAAEDIGTSAVDVSASTDALNRSAGDVLGFDKGGNWGKRDVVVDAACLEATSLDDWRVVARRMRKFYHPDRTTPKAIETYLGLTSLQLRVLMSYISAYCAPLHLMIESVYKRLHRAIENIAVTIAKVKVYEAYLKRTGELRSTSNEGGREITIDDGGDGSAASGTIAASTQENASGNTKRQRIEHRDSVPPAPEENVPESDPVSAPQRRNVRVRITKRYRFADLSELPNDSETAELVDELYSGYKDSEIEDMDEDTLQMLHEHGVVIAEEISEEYEVSDSEEVAPVSDARAEETQNRDGVQETSRKSDRNGAPASGPTSANKAAVRKSEVGDFRKRDQGPNAPRGAVPSGPRQGNYRQGDNRPYYDGKGAGGGQYNAPRGVPDSYDRPDARGDYRGGDRFNDGRPIAYQGDWRGGDWDRFDERRDFDRRDFDRDPRGAAGGHYPPGPGAWNDRPNYESDRYYGGPDGPRDGWNRERTDYRGPDRRSHSDLYPNNGSAPGRYPSGGPGYGGNYDARPVHDRVGNTWDSRNAGGYRDDRRGPPINGNSSNAFRRDVEPTGARHPGGNYGGRR